MPQLMIPHLRTELTLSQPWTFKLHAEHRNSDFRQLLGLEIPYSAAATEEQWQAWRKSRDEVYDVTLPAGTVLSVDRIFIRNGMAEYDSVTFRIRSHPDLKKCKSRFWVKLDDANNIVYT
jgi:hypothetical protein